MNKAIVAASQPPEQRQQRHLPFGKVSIAFTRNPNVSKEAKALYAVMVGYADINNRTGTAGRKRVIPNPVSKSDTPPGIVGGRATATPSIDDDHGCANW
jgi:hypothetical protein